MPSRLARSDDSSSARHARRLKVVLFAFGGASLALALARSVRAEIGPFDATVSVRPSLRGRTDVRLAPLGNIELDTHDAPVALEIRVGGAVGALLASLHASSLLLGAATGGVLAPAVGIAAAATFDTDALAEPHYSELLTVAM